MAKTLTIRTQSAELESLIRDFDKLSKSEQKAVLESSALGKTIDRTGSRGRAAFKSIGDSASQTALAIVGIGGAVGAVQKIISMASAEWDGFLARLDKAKATNIDLATARAQALAQKPQELPAPEMDAMLKRVAAASGATLRDVYLAAGNPFSALGTLPLPALEASLTPAAKFGRLTGADAGAVGELAGSLLAIIRAEQLAGPQAGEQALGFSRSVGSQMRVTDIGSQVRSLAPVLGAANQIGVDRQAAAALLAWLTYQAEDTEGRKSSTASIQFMSKIMRDVDLGMDLVANTFEGRLQELAQRLAAMPVPEREKFLSGFGGEAKFQAAFGALMTGDAAALQDLATIRSRIPRAGSDTALAAGREFFTDASRFAPMGVKEISDWGKRRAEEFQATDPFAAAGAARDAIAEQLDAIGELKAASRLRKLAFDARVFAGGADPLSAASDILGTTAAKYASTRAGQLLGEEGRANPSADARKFALLQDSIRQLDTLRSQLGPGPGTDLSAPGAALGLPVDVYQRSRGAIGSSAYQPTSASEALRPAVVPAGPATLIPLAEANLELGRELSGAIDRLGRELSGAMTQRDTSREIPPDALTGGPQL